MIPSRTCTGCSTAPRCTGSRASTRRLPANRRPTSRVPGRSARSSSGSSRGWTQAGSQSRDPGARAGTLASYARPGQHWTFYEIDPTIERIARDPRYFTYLRDCRAESIRHRAGRCPAAAARGTRSRLRLIVLDAFSSDSLPVHLLSREAIRLYRSKLAPRRRAGVQPVEPLPRPRPGDGRQAATPAWLAGSATTSSSVPRKSGPASSRRSGP